MYCAKCGEELKTSWKHCLRCGARIFSTQREKHPPELPKTPETDNAKKTPPAVKGGKITKEVKFLIGGALLFLAVIAVFGKGGRETPQIQKTQPATQIEEEAKRKAAEEAEKKATVKAAEAERKAEAERRKKQRNKWAQQYCSERKSLWDTFFPLFKNSSLRVTKDNYKKGSNLALEDCKRNINGLSNAGFEENIPKIVAGKFWIDMSVWELLASIGAPDDINKSNYGFGTSEQWVYYKDSYGISAFYIYIEDDIVTSYQDF